MSQMQIDQVLAQIRSYAPHSLKRPEQAVSAGGAAPAQFGDLLRQGVEAVNRSQQSASNLAVAWEQGKPGVELAQVMIESQKASVSFRALTEVRNRLVNAYQEVMNMPI